MVNCHVFLPGLLLGSAELSRGPYAPPSVSALMLPKTLTIDEALPTLSTLIGSLSCVNPVVNLQLLSSGITLPADTTEERSVLNVGLVMCDQVGVDAKLLVT